MLLRTIVFFSLYVVFLPGESESNRLYFSKCGSGGFSCQNLIKNGTNVVAVYLTCPSDDITLFVNQFNSLQNMESLQIHNCKNLTISFRCADKRVLFQSVIIKNIAVLKIDSPQYASLPPKIVHIENVSYIEAIPSFSFSQKSDTGCGITKQDFKTMILKNVNIDTIQSNAIMMPRKCENFTIQGVQIKRMQTSAILVKLDNNAKFTVEDSNIEIIEHLAFQVTGSKVTFSGNRFIDIAASGINGTIKNFNFTGNIINTVQSYGISILCTNTRILHNKFEYLKSNAFEKITPGLLEESGISFGNLKFLYEFKFNTIKYMDAGCLHPDYLAYENVATNMYIEKNSILCSCLNIGWIFSGSGHGHNTEHLISFYKLLLEKNRENNCLSTCNVPLYRTSEIFKEGKCPEYDSPDLICTKTTNPIPTVPSPTKPTKPYTIESPAKMLKLHNFSITKSPLDILLAFMLICVFTILK